MKPILVVGGAGYIGSYMCKYLSLSGYTPIVLDNLVYGHRQAVKWGPFFQGNMEDSCLLDKIFTEFDIIAVMHFAAYAYVGESVVDPGKYYQNNVAATISLLQAMVKNKINNFIFSSTCATYGVPETTPITEQAPQQPINPYGYTKVMVEQILADFKNAHGLESISLRYFNAAGADPDGEVGEDHKPETHLIPLVLQTALGQRKQIEIFGDDYQTRDGSCIRDYIHITDLAQAHLLAVESLLHGESGDNFNLGNGEGYSVKEIVKLAREITGQKIPAKIVDKRPGDPAVLIGSSQKAKEILGWKPEFPEIEVILETAWQWHKNHPTGY
jgi:UDP-glucose-4-epimerase GalE